MRIFGETQHIKKCCKTRTMVARLQKSNEMAAQFCSKIYNLFKGSTKFTRIILKLTF